MTIPVEVVNTGLKTAAGASIEKGIWTLVVGGVVALALSIVKQWGPWKQGDTAARAADFERLRLEIATLKSDSKEASEVQNKRIAKVEAEAEGARAEAVTAKEHAMRSDGKLRSVIAACELLLGRVKRDLPDAPEIDIVMRLLAQAATEDMGLGDAYKKLATIKGTGE